MSRRFYIAHADRLAAQYDALPFEQVHAPLLSQVPYSPSLVLDIGAGSGRDAAWMAGKGHQVVAVEPVEAFRDHGRRTHPSERIQWMDDQLPALERVMRSGMRFDIIMMSAVIMHLTETDRQRTIRKCAQLLKPGGLLYLTVRRGPPDPERGVYEVSDASLSETARLQGLKCEFVEHTSDAMGRSEINWAHHAYRMPDDGHGALTLLRSIILNDDKQATYKLGLLRSIARIAQDHASLADYSEEGYVRIPMGAVAMTWLRLYLPLLRANLPQSRKNNSGGAALGFVTSSDPVKRMLAEYPVGELRIGGLIPAGRERDWLGAVRKTAHLVKDMPMTFTTYADGSQVFTYIPDSDAALVRELRQITPALLGTFGSVRMSEALWLAFQDYQVWIEPVLVSEWIGLMRTYAEWQGRTIDWERARTAMMWSTPERDVLDVKQRIRDLRASGMPIHCVWSGKKLDDGVLDIDHCIPWSAWACGDLWNLMPAHRTVNQREKRDRIPTMDRLIHSEDRILSWWEQAYVSDRRLTDRFRLEAEASLPIQGNLLHSSDILDGLRLVRTRLWNQQGLTEW